MKFLYGYDADHYIDITSMVFQHCFSDSCIMIPGNDNLRANIFGDPFPNILKHIIIDENNTKYTYTVYKMDSLVNFLRTFRWNLKMLSSINENFSHAASIFLDGKKKECILCN